MHRYQVVYRQSRDDHAYSVPENGTVYIERPKPVFRDDILNVHDVAVFVDVIVSTAAGHILCVTPLGPAKHA